MDNNGWPDAARPGVPLNPERDGWHWLEWMDYCGTNPTGIIDQFKWERDGYWDRTTHRSARYWACWRYLGPCLTPAETEARVADALKWRGAINDALTNWLSPIEDHETPEDALQRLIRLEVMAALDPAVSQSAADLVAKARRDALEDAAREIDCGCDIRAAVSERLESQGERQAKWLCSNGDTCCALQAATIRAMKGEGDD
jgi:hypothetical protein